MTRQELYNLVDGLTQDIDFEYEGKQGSICPFARDRIAVCFDGESFIAGSVEEALSIGIVNGVSISAICDRIDFT